MKIVLGNFDPKVGRKEIFKPTIENENLHKISVDSNKAKFYSGGN
jgi:hypothetical protein